jgi:CheY-like chemotaxis protein
MVAIRCTSDGVFMATDAYLERRHILVVDDDPTVSLTVAEALRDDGYAVETAENGLIALEKIRQSPPVVVVLDLMMPVMDGWTFLERCRADEHCPDSRIVVLSAAHRSATADLGAAAFVSKPFDLNALLDTVERLASG